MPQYGVDTGRFTKKESFISLKVLYDGLPSTSGCETCQEVNGENVHWCCRTQSPSMFYVEFLYIWEHVKTWKKQDRLALFLRSIKNYLSTSHDKGCVFYDSKCTTYSRRPLSCRNYGILSDEVWQQRVSAVKGHSENHDPKSQCNLVSGPRINKTQDTKWFFHTAKAEAKLGVPLNIIKQHDLPGGSYRTFHDHILLEIFDDSVLSALTKFKLSKPKEEDIDGAMTALLDRLRIV